MLIVPSRRLFSAFPPLSVLVGQFEQEKDLSLTSCADYMEGWVISKVSEDEFTLFQPSLDELRRQSKRFVEHIDTKEGFNKFLMFYSVFGPPDRESWKGLKERAETIIDKFDD